MKGCELCERAARMYCESDQASLCWECDAKVHGANFLVARHTRCLLCRSCQAPTPWSASGARLGPTASFCERCFLQGKQRPQDHEGDDDGGSGEEKDDEEDEEDDQMKDDEGEDQAEGQGQGEGNEAEDEEEDGDYQVVPWSPTPPPVASSSSSEESSSKICDGFMKRMRGNADLAPRGSPLTASPQDHVSSSQPSYLASAPAPSRSTKDCKKVTLLRSASPVQTAPSQPVKPKSTTTTDSSAAAIVDARHRRDSRAVDLAPSNSSSRPI